MSCDVLRIRSAGGAALAQRLALWPFRSCAALAYPNTQPDVTPTEWSQRSPLGAPSDPLNVATPSLQHLQQPHLSKWLLLRKRWSPLARPRRLPVSFLPQNQPPPPLSAHYFGTVRRRLRPPAGSAPHPHCPWCAVPAPAASSAARPPSHSPPLCGVTTVPNPKINSLLRDYTTQALRGHPGPPIPPPRFRHVALPTATTTVIKPSDLQHSGRAVPCYRGPAVASQHGVAPLATQSEPYNHPRRCNCSRPFEPASDPTSLVFSLAVPPNVVGAEEVEGGPEIGNMLRIHYRSVLGCRQQHLRRDLPNLNSAQTFRASWPR